MPNELITRNANIYTYPEHIERPNTPQLSIGDLHANAMLLMYFLVSTGVVNINQEDYARLVEIYRKKVLTAEDLSEFNTLIDQLTIDENAPLIRFIGDEICDRGQNDYFIFKILDKLKKSGVKSEILLSNHGIEFLIPYERNDKLAAPNINFNQQADSLNRMRELIDKGLVNKNSLDALVHQSYLPQLKLLSYSLEGEGITIYSHAGIGLKTIKLLAEKFDVQYKDDTAADLASTIEQINVSFAGHVNNKTVHTLVLSPRDRGYGTPEKDPVNFLLWNREYGDLDRAEENKGYPVAYVHGHDSRDLTGRNIFNLDSKLGKFTEPGPDINYESNRPYLRDWHRGTLLLLKGEGAPLLTAFHLQERLAAYSSAASAASNTHPNQMSATLPSQQNIARDRLLNNCPSISSALKDLQNQINTIDKEKNTAAFNCATSLLNELNASYKTYRQQLNQISANVSQIVSEFRTNYEKAFSNTTILSSDLGWGGLLINKLKVFANAIISVANSVIALTTGREGFFANYLPEMTDSAAYDGFQSRARQNLEPHVETVLPEGGGRLSLSL